jgi:type VI secretion system secreted protein Hcp
MGALPPIVKAEVAEVVDLAHRGDKRAPADPGRTDEHGGGARNARMDLDRGKPEEERRRSDVSAEEWFTMRRSLIWCSVLVFIVAAFGVAPAAQAADDYFLQIQSNTIPQALPVKGESQAVGFKDAIELRSFSWGGENPLTIGSSTTGLSTGKAKLGELTVTKNIDSASPALFQRLTTGINDPGMRLTVRKAGPTPFVYLQYQFKSVVVTSVKHSGDGDATQETVNFAYIAVAQKYTSQTATGAAGPAIQWGWDQTLNTQFLYSFIAL